MNDQIRDLRAQAQVLREHATRSCDPLTYGELLMDARECEKLAVELEAELRSRLLERPPETRRLRRQQKFH